MDFCAPASNDRQRRAARMFVQAWPGRKAAKPGFVRTLGDVKCGSELGLFAPVFVCGPKLGGPENDATVASSASASSSLATRANTLQGQLKITPAARYQPAGPPASSVFVVWRPLSRPVVQPADCLLLHNQAEVCHRSHKRASPRSAEGKRAIGQPGGRAKKLLVYCLFVNFPSPSARLRRRPASSSSSSFASVSQRNSQSRDRRAWR